jgi:hypothetical protein
MSKNYHDLRDRSAVVLFPAASPTPEHPSPYDQIISMRWGMGNHLMYDPYSGKNKVWNYRFRSVPGLREMDLTVAGQKPKVWIDGKIVPEKNIRLLSNGTKGIRNYRVTLDKVQEKAGTVAFSIERETGYQGAAVLCEPVKLTTSKGLLTSGNWSETGALKYYSGGMYYRKKVTIPPVRKGGKVVLDLGDVIASCELKVNGQWAGILMSPPYQSDITSFIKSGTNEIEVLVYSTLSNHYQTMPTPYRGDAKAGLLGPITLSFYE